MEIRFFSSLEFPGWGADCRQFLGTLPRPLKRLIDIHPEDGKPGRFYSLDELRELAG